jgi:hypothetical protein
MTNDEAPMEIRSPNDESLSEQWLSWHLIFVISHSFVIRA